MTSAPGDRENLAARGDRLLTFLPVVVAVAAIAVGLVWWWRPASYPYGPADLVTVGLNHLLPRATGVLLLVGAGCVGLGAAAFARGGGRLRRATGVAAAGEALLFAVVLADPSVMSILGYLVAVGVPVGVVALLVVLGVVRPRAGLVAAAALAGVVAVAAGTGLLRGYLTFWTHLLSGLAVYGGRAAWSLAMAGAAAVWAWVAWRRLVPGPACGPARTASVGDRPLRPRWAVVATIIAAACPLPYGLVRLTWLTPWAIGLAPAYDGLAIRIQGASLGVASVLGCVLTLGLISRWGEVVPGWVPVVGGRSVPVRLAVVPGSVVTAALLIAAPGFVASFVDAGLRAALLGLLVFPFPVWGPALGAAVLAYRMRRTPRTGLGHGV